MFERSSDIPIVMSKCYPHNVWAYREYWKPTNNGQSSGEVRGCDVQERYTYWYETVVREVKSAEREAT